MKFFISFFFFLFLNNPLLSEEFKAEYALKTKGLTIGKLYWSVNIQEESYETLIKLKNKGFLSGVLKFDGDYKVSGQNINNTLIPKEYDQKWSTSKKQRDVKIIFKDHKITDLKILPEETEAPRFEYLKLVGYNDPLTSFLNIMFKKESSKTIDGRRSYILTPLKKNNSTKIIIEKYQNLWADHKRNDLEFIEIFAKDKDGLPQKINIKFKGSVFSLIKI